MKKRNKSKILMDQAKARSGGEHVNSSQKRVKQKLKKEQEESSDELSSSFK